MSFFPPKKLIPEGTTRTRVREAAVSGNLDEMTIWEYVESDRKALLAMAKREFRKLGAYMPHGLEAEDLLHDAALRLAPCWAAIESRRGSFASMIRHIRIDVFRRHCGRRGQWSHVELDKLAGVASEDDPSAGVVSDCALSEILGACRPKDRVIALHVANGVSNEDGARELGITPNAYAGRKFLWVRRMRRLIDDPLH